MCARVDLRACGTGSSDVLHPERSSTLRTRLRGPVADDAVFALRARLRAAGAAARCERGCAL
jgi:hypothetical protein